MNYHCYGTTFFIEEDIIGTMRWWAIKAMYTWIV